MRQRQRGSWSLAFRRAGPSSRTPGESGDRALINAERLDGRLLPREASGTPQALLAHSGATFPIGSQRGDLRGKLADVFRIEVLGGVPTHLRQRGTVRREDRHPCCHRLENREPEAFVERRKNEEIGAREDSIALPVWKPAHDTNAGVRGTRTFRRISNQDKVVPQSVSLASQRERSAKTGDVLVRARRGERDDVRTTAGFPGRGRSTGRR